MSHTITVQGWNLHFNGDYSGTVGIVSPDGENMLDVPFDVLAELVGGALQDKHARELESMTGLEYLGAITCAGPGR